MNFLKLFNFFKGKRKDDVEFYEYGLTHAEAAVNLLKKANKELSTEEIFKMINYMKLIRRVSNSHSLYATLTRLKHKGIIDYSPRNKKWQTK